MAIEFNCPYCTATIRVPDQFSGKRGSCPKCATKLMVPDVAPPARKSAPSTSVPSTSAGSSVGHSAPDTGPPVAPDSFGAQVASGVPPFAPATVDSSLSRSLRRKERRKKSRRIYSVGIPIICFVAFFGIIAAVMLMKTPELKGTLRGSVSQGMQIPQATFPFSELTLTDKERRLAADAFAKETESFISPRMTCRISAEGNKLAVDVTAGDGFVWLAVNPGGDINLMSWIRAHTASLNQARLAKIATIGAELCRDKIRKANGSSVVFDAEQYRDGFGLNVHLNAFGFAVEGIVDRQLTPCAHEDTNGTLYFAVPAEAKSLTLRGRSISGGRPLFPGEYVVPIVATGASAAVPATETPAETRPADDDSMNDSDNTMEADAATSEMSPSENSSPGMQPNMTPN